MADSKRLKILKALTAIIETVTVDNGYQHDLEGRVSRGRVYFGRETPLPWVSILEGVNPDTAPSRAGANAVQRDSWVLLINGWAEDDPDHPSDPAHNLMADVKKALSTILDIGPDRDPNPDYMLGGLLADFAIEPGVVRPPDELSERAYFYLRVVVGVSEKLADPYQVPA